MFRGSHNCLIVAGPVFWPGCSAGTYSSAHAHVTFFCPSSFQIFFSLLVLLILRLVLVLPAYIDVDNTEASHAKTPALYIVYIELSILFQHGRLLLESTTQSSKTPTVINLIPLAFAHKHPAPPQFVSIVTGCCWSPTQSRHRILFYQFGMKDVLERGAPAKLEPILWMDSVDGDYVLTPASSSSSSPGKKKKSLEDDASLLVLSSLISAPSRPKVQSSGGERPFQTFFLFLWQIEARFSSTSSSSLQQ